MYDWGGYLIWRLYPFGKVFVDNRQLDVKIVLIAEQIYNAKEDPHVGDYPYYEAQLNQYNVDFILIAPSYLDGSIMPLLEKMVDNPRWSPIYFDEYSIIFAKNTISNNKIVKDYSITGDILVNGLLDKFDNLLNRFPNAYQLYISKGDLYRYQNKILAAKNSYLAALNIAPFNPVAMSKLKELRLKEVQ